MSGSAALASARRRRAIPINNPINPENKVIGKNENVEPPKMIPTNPVVLLVKHNEMINLLQNDVSSIKTQLSSMNEKSDSNKPENIEYFKSQYLILLEEMKEIKKTLLKIQTFSMETNLEVMKLKRIIKLDTETTPETS